MKEAARRALRSFFQGFLAVVIAQGGFTLTQTDIALVRAGAAAGILAAVVFLHNYLEDHVPAIDTRALPVVRKGKKVK